MRCTSRMADPHDLTALIRGLQGLGLGWGVPPSPTWSGHPLRRRRRSKPVTYRVRLDLMDAKPPIWRRLDLASDLFLDDVHEVIQVAMGWTNSHLHAFAAGGRAFGPGALCFLNAFDVEEGEEGTDEAEVRLDEILHGPGDRLWYEYDYGDGWSHVLKLEKVLPRAGDTAAVCVGGRRACPPEDCGGVYGYQELLAYAVDPAGAPEWVAEAMDHYLSADEFDPAAFDLDEVNEALADAL